MAQPFHIIVAHDQNRGIGKNNAIPWHLPVDLRYFKAITTEAARGCMNAVIMGRNTWASIPPQFRPLPGRVNIVLSRSITKLDDAVVLPCLDDALAYCEKNPSIQTPFVIGGSQIYAMALAHPHCERLYVTKVFASFDCDTHFPPYHQTFACVYASNIWVNTQGTCGFYQYKPRAVIQN